MRDEKKKKFLRKTEMITRIKSLVLEAKVMNGTCYHIELSIACLDIL